LENPQQNNQKKHETTIPEIITNIGVLLAQFTEALEDHEKRIQTLETADLRAELQELEEEIQHIPDEKKRAQASTAFAGLCQMLGITNVEDQKSGK
jgi:hypothetical protein